MASNNYCTVLIKQFTDHLLLFGSTGLVGSLILKELKRVDFHLTNSQDIQNKIDSCGHPEITDFRFDKFVYCITRRVKKSCHLEDEQAIETGGVPPLRYKNQDYSFDRVEILSSECSTVLRDDKPREFRTMIIKEDCVEEAFNFHIDQYRYQASYVAKNLEKLQIAFSINVVQISHTDSRKWSGLLPFIFSGCVNMGFGAANSPAQIRLPPLDEIPTMVCALGFKSAGAKKSKVNRHFVDHELTLQIAKVFNNCENKKLVIVTTFNNVLISHIFPYFRTKSKLEYDLQYSLSPRFGRLVLLRPGPMVGEHADMRERRVKPNSSRNLLKQGLYYKQCCFHCKVLLFKECRRTGLKTMASELIANTMYRRPGSWILGYCLPASKVAYTAALKAVEPPINGTKHLVEIVTSQEMDRLVVN